MKTIKTGEKYKNFGKLQCRGQRLNLGILSSNSAQKLWYMNVISTIQQQSYFAKKDFSKETITSKFQTLSNPSKTETGLFSITMQYTNNYGCPVSHLQL